jgi:hypothetical protein
MRHVKLGQLVILVGTALLVNLPQVVAPLTVLAQQGSTLRQGFPGRRIGGGTRGDCGVSDKKLTALVPDNMLSVTAAASPSFFYYIPDELTSKQVEFVLRDQDENSFYATALTLPNRPGIISLSLPSSAALSVNQDYHWYFSIICDNRDRSGDIVVDGWIRRVDLPSALATRLRAANPLEQAALYREAGIWNEALTALAGLRRNRANDPAIAQRWEELLESIDLGAIAQEPLTNTYSGTPQ